ncbi:MULTISPECIES: TIGR03620 family F420-dependent LLM class oxidoreductase [Amycolatopsis]|uniref:TIGR03620 family F420-dependent LLM class oxidoreductase n=2 Tax=Amycolatopsis TaxID=1813 RepID=A0ABW5I2W5_9PSEU
MLLDLLVHFLVGTVGFMKIGLRGYGVWQVGALTTPAMAAEIEQLGYSGLWLGGPGVDLAGIDELLAATESLVVGSSIVNVWSGDPAVLARSYQRVASRFPGRFVLGIGVGHREQSAGYERPMDAVRRFLDVLDAGGVPVSGRVLAALGPRMLRLAAERAGGVVPYLVPPSHTRVARETVGSAGFVAPEQKVMVDSDVVRGLEAARGRVRNPYLGLVNYVSNLRRLGYSEEDLAGSDRLIGDLVAVGDVSAVAARLGEHRAAGADHVVVQVITEKYQTHPGLPGVRLQVYDDEVMGVYRELAEGLF